MIDYKVHFLNWAIARKILGGKDFNPINVKLGLCG